MVQSVGHQTETTLGRHLESVVARDVDRVMADYTDSSVIFTPDGPARGLDAIKGFFTNMFPVLTEMRSWATSRWCGRTLTAK
jgi:ketosteroid isomerase-like protein